MMADQNAAELRIIISAQIAKAQEDLRKVGEDAQKMAEELRASGTVSSEAIDGVKRSIEELKTQMSEVHDKVVSIDLHDDKAKIGIEEIKAMMDSVSNEKVRIKAETAKAEADLAVFKEQLATLPRDKIVKIDVDRRTIELGGGAVGNAGGRGGGLLGGLLASLIPAISPLGAAGVGGTMGLASAAAPGLAGTGGLAAVSISNLSPVFQAVSQYQKDMSAAMSATSTKAYRDDIVKAEYALRNLSGAQRQAAQSLMNFQDFWDKFSSSFQKPVFNMFSHALKMLQSLLTDMKPAISGAASAFGTLFNEASHALNSPFWKSFFSWLGANARPSILAFGHTVGNLGKGFAALLQAFSPVAKSMESGLVNLSGRFAQWASSLKGTKGFEKFLKYVQQSGHEVLSLIGNLSGIIGTLLKDMAPLGLTMVKFVNDVAKLVKNLLQSNPLVSNLAKFAFDAARDILQAADAVIRFLNWLSKSHPVIMDVVTALGLAALAWWGLNAAMDANPITLVIMAIAALVVAGVEVVKHWKQIRQFFENLWRWFETETKKVWDGIASFFKKTWNTISSDVTKVWNAIKSFFKKWGADILLALLNPIGLLVVELVKHWSTIRKDADNAWNNLMRSMKKILSTVYKTITKPFDDVGKFFSNLANDAISWGESLIGGVVKGIENDIGKVGNALGAVGHFFGIGGKSSASTNSTLTSWPASTIPSTGGGTVINITNHVSGNVTKNETELANRVASAQMQKLKRVTKTG